jgi:hypothetical protein
MMKFILPEDATEQATIHEVRIGNVYRSKNTRTTKYWVVIGINKDMVHMVGIGDSGEMTGLQTYGRWVMEGSPDGRPFKPREVVGFCDGLEDLVFSVMLNQEPPNMEKAR